MIAVSFSSHGRSHKGLPDSLLVATKSEVNEMGLMVVISIEGPTLDGSEPAQAAKLMHVLADEVVARIPKLEPGKSVRFDPRSGVRAVAIFMDA